MRGLFAWAGGLAGALLGALLVIVYDTSANTSVLEGGRRHLTFDQGVQYTAIGAAVGAFIGFSLWQARGRRADQPRPPDAP